MNVPASLSGLVTIREVRRTPRPAGRRIRRRKYAIRRALPKPGKPQICPTCGQIFAEGKCRRTRCRVASGTARQSSTEASRE